MFGPQLNILHSLKKGAYSLVVGEEVTHLIGQKALGDWI